MSSGPPPTFSILAHCGGIVGVSFWGIVLAAVFFLEAALFHSCLTSALRSLREALERAKCSPAVCLRPKKNVTSQAPCGPAKRARQRDILRMHSCRLDFRLWSLHPQLSRFLAFFVAFSRAEHLVLKITRRCTRSSKELAQLVPVLRKFLVNFLD